MKSPLRYLYENVYGTDITIVDECTYILICIQECVRILWSKKTKWIYNVWDEHSEYMELQIDHYEKDLLIDCIQHRLDTDKILIINDSLKSEIEDLLAKVEEECV